MTTNEELMKKLDDVFNDLKYTIDCNAIDRDKDSVLRMGYALQDNWKALENIIKAARDMIPRGIESAPRDGTEILGVHFSYGEWCYSIIFWSDEGDNHFTDGSRNTSGLGMYDRYLRSESTHWMLLPQPPQAELELEKE